MKQKIERNIAGIAFVQMCWLQVSPIGGSQGKELRA